MAPVEERPDIPLARGPTPAAGLPEVQRLGHVGGDGRQGVGAELRRDEFEQQRQAIQARAEGGDRRGVRGGHGERGIGLHRARAEELCRLAPREFVRREVGLGLGEGERRDAADYLPRQP